jgi:hypothetical protein
MGIVIAYIHKVTIALSEPGNENENMKEKGDDEVEDPKEEKVDM